MKFKSGDIVVVIAGKDRNATGKIMKLDKKNDRVVVEGVNMVKRHVKKRGNQAGSIAQFEAPLHASNVMLLDPKTKKATRIGHQMDEKGKKQRITKASKTVL